MCHIHLEQAKKPLEKSPAEYLNEILGTLYYCVTFYHIHSNRTNDEYRICIWDDSADLQGVAFSKNILIGADFTGAINQPIGEIDCIGEPIGATFTCID